MWRLIYACAVKYLKSAELYAALAAGLIMGVINGAIEWQLYRGFYSGSADKTEYLICPIDSKWYDCAVWAFALLVALHIGREFSDGTIKNKLAAGHTKAAVYLSESITACAAALPYFILLMIPIIIGGGGFFFNIPINSAARIILMLFIMFPAAAVITSTVCMITADRAAGMTAVILAMALLTTSNALLNGYYNNTEGEYLTETEAVKTSTGEYKTDKHKIKNRFYLKGIKKAAVTAEHKINLFSRVSDAELAGCERRGSSTDTNRRYAVYNMLTGEELPVERSCGELIIVSLAAAAIGAEGFKKRDIS